MCLHIKLYIKFLLCKEIYFFFFVPSKVTSSGDAKKIDEYVPAITPTRRTKAKSFVDSPPIKYSATSAKKIVNEVLIDLPKVSVTDLPTVSVNGS